MKAIKVRIRRGALGEDAMVYPARYNAQEVDRFGVGPCGVNFASISYSGAFRRGASEEHCIILLEDDLATEYAQDPDMEIVTAGEADALMEVWRIGNGAPEEVLLDTNRIDLIRAKRDAGIPLSSDDQDALDATKPTRGINKARRSVREKVAERGRSID